MPEPTLFLLLSVVAFAVAFDFVNGFHDAANSIATIVATRVLSPFRAVLWAATFNFAAVFVFDTGVAKMVGNGMVAQEFVTLTVILAGLMGATGWGITTWWFKLPTSSSHALLGAYAGAAITNYALQHGWEHSLSVILWSGWGKTLLFIFLAPTLGLLLGGVVMKTVMLLTAKIPHEKSDKSFAALQLLSSAFLSLTHGGNDAQKTAGIITGALLTYGAVDHFVIPTWVLVLSYGTMAFGTLCGGWRIVDTLGQQLTRLRPPGGFCAEVSAASSILLATLLKLPVSTTHVTTGAILGTGAARNVGAVRWNIAGNILIAWVITIPAAAMLGGAILALLRPHFATP